MSKSFFFRGLRGYPFLTLKNEALSKEVSNVTLGWLSQDNGEKFPLKCNHRGHL